MSKNKNKKITFAKKIKGVPSRNTYEDTGACGP
jgi:hypothetical protein